MNIFTKWDWIKRNWQYILEEAQPLELIFVGGTALNLLIFEEYRASEDIDLYNPNSKGIDNPHGRSEEELVRELSKKLADKGFEIHDVKGRSFYIGPNVKVEIFHDATPFKKIEKKVKDGTSVSIFDFGTYAEMKMAALLCRTIYDPRDLVDVFILRSQGGINLKFPDRECEVIEHSLNKRILEISKTKMQDLLLFQNKQQVDALSSDRFMEFKRWLVEWLSRFR